MKLFYLFILITVVLIFYMTQPDIHLQPGQVNQNQRQNTGFVKPEHHLLHIFQSFSSGTKVKLNGICGETVYTKHTIPTDIQESSVHIVKRLIQSLMKVSQRDYYMKDIENVYILKDKKQNQRFIIDFFVYDIKNYYTIRLLSDVVILDGTSYLNYLNIQSGSNSTVLNKYDLKFDNSGILLGSDNIFRENIGQMFDTMYQNSFQVIGINDTHLEYTHEDLSDVLTLESLEHGYYPSHMSPNSVQDLQEKSLGGHLQMYYPPSQHTITDPLFCHKHHLEWDSLGIPYENKDIPDTCIRHTNQVKDKLNDPWFGPGIMYDRSSNDAYRWFKERGNIVPVL
jgi:hypothetical protein